MGANKESSQLTVNGNGDSLGQGVAIFAEEGRDLAKRVGLEVLNGGLLRVGRDDVQLEVVGLRNRLDGSGAGVVLLSLSQRLREQIRGVFEV